MPVASWWRFPKGGFSWLVTFQGISRKSACIRTRKTCRICTPPLWNALRIPPTHKHTHTSFQRYRFETSVSRPCHARATLQASACRTSPTPAWGSRHCYGHVHVSIYLSIYLSNVYYIILYYKILYYNILSYMIWYGLRDAPGTATVSSRLFNYIFVTLAFVFHRLFLAMYVSLCLFMVLLYPQAIMTFFSISSTILKSMCLFMVFLYPSFYVCIYIYIYIDIYVCLIDRKHYWTLQDELRLRDPHDQTSSRATAATPGLRYKIPHHKIFARVWVAQEPFCS